LPSSYLLIQRLVTHLSWKASFRKEKRSRSPFYCGHPAWHGHPGHVPRGTRSVPRSRAARTFRPCIARPQAEQNGPRPGFKRRRGTQSSMAYQGRTIIQAPPPQATPISRQNMPRCTRLKGPSTPGHHKELGYTFPTTPVDFLDVARYHRGNEPRRHRSVAIVG
jgi:hypothetical protein